MDAASFLARQEEKRRKKKMMAQIRKFFDALLKVFYLLVIGYCIGFAKLFTPLIIGFILYIVHYFTSRSYCICASQAFVDVDLPYYRFCTLPITALVDHIV